MWRTIDLLVAVRQHMSRPLIASMVIVSLGIAADNVSSNESVEELSDLKEQLNETVQAIERLKSEFSSSENHTDNNFYTTFNSQHLENLESRLNYLKNRVSAVPEKIGDNAISYAIDAVNFNRGDYYDLTAMYANSENETTTSFNRQVFNTLVSAKLSAYLQAIYPIVTKGINFYGKRFIGNTNQNSLSYHLISSGFTGNSTEFNIRGRLGYDLGNSGVSFGVNANNSEHRKGINSDIPVFGADMLYEQGAVLWKSEFYSTTEDQSEDRRAFYTRSDWRFRSNWIAYYRFDFLDEGSNVNTLESFGRSTEHSVGLTYKPNSNVHFRGILTQMEFDPTPAKPEANAQSFQLSTTLNF